MAEVGGLILGARCDGLFEADARDVSAVWGNLKMRFAAGMPQDDRIFVVVEVFKALNLKPDTLLCRREVVSGTR